MDEQIAELAGFAESHRAELDALRPDCEVDVFCGVFSEDAQGGFTLERELLSRLAALDLAVTFDIY